MARTKIDKTPACIVWKRADQNKTVPGPGMRLRDARETVAYNQRVYGGTKMPQRPHLIVRLKALKPDCILSNDRGPR